MPAVLTSFDSIDGEVMVVSVVVEVVSKEIELFIIVNVSGLKKERDEINCAFLPFKCFAGSGCNSIDARSVGLIGHGVTVLPRRTSVSGNTLLLISSCGVC